MEEGIDKYRIRGMFNLEDLCAENFRDIFLEYLNLFSEHFHDDTIQHKEGEKYEDVEIETFKNLLIQFYDEDNVELIEILANSIGGGNGINDYFNVHLTYNYGYKDWRNEHPDDDPEDFYHGFAYMDDVDVYILRTDSKFYVAQLPRWGPRDEYGWYPIEIDEKNLKQQIEKELNKIDEEYN
jgi:hypothetical protein